MPKVEGWEELLDQDTSVGVPDEAIPKYQHHKAVSLPASQTRQTPQLVLVKRLLDPEDVGRITTGVRELHEGDGDDIIGEGFSLFPLVIAHRVLADYFLHDTAATTKPHVRLNRRVNKFLGQDQDRNVKITAHLGEITVIKTAQPFVAAILRDTFPMTIDDLREQYYRLLYHVTKDETFSRNKVQGDNTFPHYSLAQFTTVPPAEALQQKLIDQGGHIFEQPVTIRPPSPKRVALPAYFDYRV